MRIGPAPRLWTLAIAAVSAAAIVLLVVLLARFPEVGVWDTIVVVLLALPALVLGTIIALRRPDNRVAPLLTLVGAMLLIVVALGDEATAIEAAHPGTLPTPSWLASLSGGSWVLLYVPTAFLLLVFPDGRFPTRAARRIGVGTGIVTVAFMIIAGGPTDGFDPPVTTPPAYRLPAAFGVIGLGLVLCFMVALLASAYTMIQRYRRATSTVERAQMRWFALGSMLLPFTLLLCWLSYLLIGSADFVMIGIGLTAIAIPAATTIALLRHDLYDVDRAFTATVTYSLVTAVLLGIFAAAEALAGAALGHESPAAAAGATAVCALALAPLRTRLSDVVERRLYPLRRSVRAAVADLRSKIDAGHARPEDLPGVLRTALRDPDLRIGYVLPGRVGLVDSRCLPLAADGVPVLVGGNPVGALIPGAGIASRELLRETAAGSALLVEVIRSRLELTEALREVADSRARLLQAGYRERRRLERDLHDGAQQRLVSLGMAIRLAQRRLEAGSEQDVNGLLDQAVAELSTAVAELRAIAQGLRPLDLDAGLGPAIRSLTTSLPIPVHLAVPDEPVPDEVATTAYYVASEALANVVKHSEAETVDIRVERHPAHVLVRVSDDGRGGAVARPGSGLAGLVDRVAAAGGTFSVGGAMGTTVEAVLPCSP
jgi:signal transduction histidine kinase